MRYSKLFGKTSRGTGKGSDLESHQLLLRGGFIRESTAGRYYFLPLGWRVHEKIRTIIKEEMDAAGAQEMVTPVLHPLELWQETNRTKTTGFELTKVTDRRGAEFALGGTAEEMFVEIVRRFNLSYKDLPFNIYQFSTKFRDELRARGGLLRVREFMMKDAYSFDRDEDGFKNEYRKMGETYTKIFKRLGLNTIPVAADNGYIGGEYCHEYVVESEIGESRYFVSEDGQFAAHEDVAKCVLDPVNPDEAVKEMQIVEQPQWVKTIDDDVKHYGKERQYFLKNVLYRTIQGDVVIVTIRGDLEVNRTKLEHVLNLVGQLEEATDEDLLMIGTKRGYVHAWGHTFSHKLQVTSNKQPDSAVASSSKQVTNNKVNPRVIYVADESLKTVRNLIGGQKEDSTDSINVNYGRDFKHEIEADVAYTKPGMQAPDKHGKLIEKRGIEVGNIFQLGYHYTKLMKGANYIDSDGQEKPYYMGCYGIGLGRTLATIVEKFHDDKGIIWPEVAAPFQAHLVSLENQDLGIKNLAENIYNRLIQAGIEVLWDDREESPGVKFADADLIGIPVRLVVSKRSGDKVEWKRRDEQESELLSVDEVVERLKSRS
jgi:prolyl-tRNA synthetase